MSTSPNPGHDEAGPGLDAFIRERRQLINLTYRLLGSLADAEDAVQETYARWYALSPPQKEAIESPGAWLTTVASRICWTSSARRTPSARPTWANGSPSRCPTCGVGRRLSPRPAVDPADRVTLDESVNMAFLVVLDSMTPAERGTVRPARRLRLPLR